MRRMLLATILLSPLPAIAQDATAALKRAYQINGNSMVRMGTIDLTETPGVVRTIKVIPEPVVEKPVAEPVVAKPVRKAELVSDICTRHGKRKVMRNNGKSWRCK